MSPNRCPALSSSPGLAPLPDQYFRVHPESLGQLPHCAWVRPLASVLKTPDSVVGDAGPLLQLPQGENPFPPQFLKSLHVDLHTRHFALLLIQNTTTICT